MKRIYLFNKNYSEIKVRELLPIIIIFNGKKWNKSHHSPLVLILISCKDNHATQNTISIIDIYFLFSDKNIISDKKNAVKILFYTRKRYKKCNIFYQF